MLSCISRNFSKARLTGRREPAASEPTSPLAELHREASVPPTAGRRPGPPGLGEVASEAWCARLWLPRKQPGRSRCAGTGGLGAGRRRAGRGGLPAGNRAAAQRGLPGAPSQSFVAQPRPRSSALLLHPAPPSRNKRLVPVVRGTEGISELV